VGGYADKLQKRAIDFLRSDERLISALRTQPRGTNVGNVGGIVGDTWSGSQSKKAMENAGEGSSAGSWPSGNTAVGLTDQRLLLFDYTVMGKPKDLVAEFSLGDVLSVELEKKKITANAVTFSFTDGSSVQVECAKLEKTADFVEAFRATKGGG
jgi:PH (Pleckstrin Homology) domain-containing protein